MVDVLHGCKAVAALKDRHRGNGDGLPLGSPRLQGRGRIEGPARPPWFRFWAAVLHGCKAVAALKDGRPPGRGGRNSPGSPRLQGRGRIEGAAGRSGRWPSGRSPRLQGRGRIEGSTAWHQVTSRVRFSTAARPWPH